ncbi:MAG: threonine synthase [Gemmatimonadetes bacterium]|nr:threonine synthase [Gemmatimonadota bacterium]
MSGWRSTRGGGAVSLAEAMFRGPAPDGGLYVPAEPLRLDARAVARASDSFQETGLAVARAFLGDEVAGPVLEATVAEVLDFPVPLVPLGDGLHVLELFHGPSLAFKDVGARFMAALMERLDPEPERTRVVLVATSGDTGSAVAHAFAGRRRFRVVVLFPADGVSERQRRLFSTLGGNVAAVAVRGTFDDCQRLVKDAFRDEAAARLGLTAANSINVGRLLPQTFYYVEAMRLGGWSEGCAFSVPSGNLGNLTAGLMAARAGLPVTRLVAALNRNDAFLRYLDTGTHAPAPSRRTVSNAMDVGDPSNLERLRHLTRGDPAALRRDVSAAAFDDDATVACIGRVHRERGYTLDPHGAVGILGAEAWRGGGGQGPVVALATAHPAKFPEVVEPATGEAVAVPPRMTLALEGEERIVPLGPHLPALLELLGDAAAGLEART